MTERAQAWAQCIQQWLASIKDHSGSEASYRMYNSIVMRFQTFLAGKSLDQVTRGDVLAFMSAPSMGRHSKVGQPVSASSQNVKLSAIQSLYTFSSAFEVVQVDGSLAYLWQRALPTVGLRSLKKDIRARQMSEEELRRFWSVIPDSPRGRRDRVLFYCYLILGRRRAELLRLRWGDITPAVIAGQPSHTYSYVGKGDSRQVRQKELPAECYQMICDLLREEGRLATIKPEDPIFLSSHRPGQPLCGDFVGQKFHKYCLDAGLPVERISLHSLRWSSAYHRAMGGSSITDVRDLLDHQSLAITSRYLSGMISTHDAGADKLTRQFSFLR